MKNKEIRQLTLYDEIFNYREIITEDYNIEKKKEDGTYIDYLDLVCSFDIETSSFLDNGNKRGLMYIWMICIEGKVTIGRTWEEFLECINYICDFYELNQYRRIIIYVHNLSYEFQWICKKFKWVNIFARDKREPMKCVTDRGLEFRCSYLLSGCSLEKVGKDLQKYKVKKLVGNLDYSILRGKNTPLTKEELDYCINDVKVVVAYVQEQKEYYGKLTKIPLTNTGRVRKLCKTRCFEGDNYYRYRNLMNSLTISLEEYKLLKRAFQGGFTHCNYLYNGDIIKNVKSWDFTSSYPTVMISELYPCTKGKKIKTTIDYIVENKNIYCFIFNIKFTNLKSTFEYENYISLSKCWDVKGSIENNGRIMSAKELKTTITEVDFDIINKLYTWDSIEVGQCYQYRKSYLPRPFVDVILELYEEKTKLKDVEGKEFDYLIKKGMLNSTYGMICMDVLSSLITFDEEKGWEELENNEYEQIKDYNKNKSRFLFYPWAVYVTAYARRNLFFGICECKEDYIYSDTDSIKIINYEKHMNFINIYNDWITKRLEKACVFQNLDPKRTRPLTIEGEEKPLGVWDDDGFYTRFKTLGAKRYLVEKKGELKGTVAGINKKKFGEYLNLQEDGFKFFDDGMCVPSDYSGKITCEYIDESTSGKIVDYLGNEMDYEETSSIYMGVSDYKLGISELYRILLNSRVKINY